MGKKKALPVKPNRVEEIAQADEDPERFDPSLLLQPRAWRLAYFEKSCTIEHRLLQQTCDDILHIVCSPGEDAGQTRLGTMALVIGPSRVGKTTLIGLLEQQLLKRADLRMQREPAHMPFVSVTATGPESGRFDWVDYYRTVLRQMNDPFVNRMTPLTRVRNVREAMEEALLQRSPVAVIVDEAHHLAKAASGRRLQDHLDHLKYFENRTGVSHILVGTYEMRPFRKVNAQLACRSVDVHFPRYDATKKEDRTEFKSVLWALQRQLPVEEEPNLLDQWEFLSARSIGCIGLLKMHLNRALELALSEQARTVTLTHLQTTAMTEDRVKLALSAALAGEADLSEPEGADERLLTLLGLRTTRGATSMSETGSHEEGQSKPSSQSRQQKPGERSPSRDPVGSHGTMNMEDATHDRERAIK